MGLFDWLFGGSGDSSSHDDDKDGSTDTKPEPDPPDPKEQLRDEAERFAYLADVEKVGNPGGNEGDEAEYVKQQWMLQEPDDDEE